MAINLNQKLSPAKRVLMFFASQVPYGAGTRLQAWFYSIGFVRHMLFNRRIEFLRRIMVLCPAGCDEQEAILRHLTCNFLMPWRVVALSRLRHSELEKWVSFESEDILREHYKKKRGVVLVNSHIGAGRIMPLMLLRQGYKITAMDPEPYLARMGAKDADKMPVISLRGGDKFWLKEVFKAKKVLERGEILTLVADGRVGLGGRQHRFHDITIPFYVSFAELALLTNSTVIPVFANINSKGRIVIEFQPSFDSGDERTPRDERINRLLDQYVACLEQKWRDNPGNILTTHVRLYNQMKAKHHAPVNTAESRE